MSGLSWTHDTIITRPNRQHHLWRFWYQIQIILHSQQKQIGHSTKETPLFLRYYNCSSIWSPWGVGDNSICIHPQYARPLTSEYTTLTIYNTCGRRNEAVCMTTPPLTISCRCAPELHCQRYCSAEPPPGSIPPHGPLRLYVGWPHWSQGSLWTDWCVTCVEV